MERRIEPLFDSITSLPRRPVRPQPNTADACAIAPPDLATARDKQLIKLLGRSRLYREFERSFSEATQMPVALRPIESWQLPFHGKDHENPFCHLMAQERKTCAACLRIQQHLIDGVHQQASTVKCDYGLRDSAVPVTLGERTIGFLQTGQVLSKAPTEEKFNRVVSLLEQQDITMDRQKLRKAFFSTRVIPEKTYAAMVKLLHFFAQHLSNASNQIAVQRENAEPSFIVRAKAYIHEHLTDPLTLGEVAKAVNTSSFYFCKMFKKVTGNNFVEYVSRMRIERAKNLLLNPNLRVSEIAYEVGFQSLTHFNRVFRTLMGQSPTRYRHRLPSR